MGTRQQELQASVDLIWEYADAACLPGSDLRPDIEYGKRLVLAAPEMLEALQRAEFLMRRIVESECADITALRDFLSAADQASAATQKATQE
jgi:hypothetical protein